MYQIDKHFYQKSLLKLMIRNRFVVENMLTNRKSTRRCMAYPNKYFITRILHFTYI